MINEKIELFLENNRALREVKGAWNVQDLMIKSNALISTMRDEKIDAHRVDEALELIKNKTKMFSIFRGISKITTAITISSQDNMEESFDEILLIYNKLKGEFSNNQYLAVASQVIFNARNRLDVNEAVKNTRQAYDCMREQHKFITGHEDIGNAAIIATTSENLEETFKEIEENYTYLKDNRISSLNNIQSLSHILSLINMNSKQKCDTVLKMNSVLKENKTPLKNYSLPMLGILSFISDTKQGIADMITETSNTLKKEKGFGDLRLGRDNRNMIAAALVTSEYIESMDENIKESLISNTNNIALTIAIAMETAVLVSISAAAVAANASL